MGVSGTANILDQLHASGSLQVLINMSYSEHVDVLSQVARGFANNSKCTKGKTHLVELGGECAAGLKRAAPSGRSQQRRADSDWRFNPLAESTY